MNGWFDHWRRPTGNAGRHRRASLRVEILEDRCVLSTIGYSQVNLASDLPGLAAVTVPTLVNPWGISFSPTGPFWFSDQGSGVSNLLNGRGQVVPLTVVIPPTGGFGSHPTGIVFNNGPGFVISAHGAAGPSTFLFASAEGTISGWTESVDIPNAVIAVDHSSLGAVYTGLALAADGAGQSVLYGANFGQSRIDVFDQNFQPIERSGAFQDPNLPAGFAPFNIQNVGGRLYVTYAQPNAHDVGEATKGAGLGFVDVFNTDGNLLARLASQGPLDAPWGVTLAPADFGRFGGALLVGNNGDGRINAFSPANGAFLGQLADDTGAPITIPDLWALTFGNGHAGGNADTLFFASGVDYDAHGLFGAIQPPQLRGADTGGSGAFNPNAPGEAKNYPLPPANGPGLPNPIIDGRPVSVLLPFAESSLVLAPTLSTDSRAGTNSPVAVNRPLIAALNTPGVCFVAPDPVAPSISPAGTVALNNFLDLSTTATARAEPASVPTLNTDRVVVDRSAFFAFDAWRFADVQSVQVEAQPDQFEQISAADLLASADTRTPRSASDARGLRNALSKVLGLFCVIGVRVGWGYLMETYQRKSEISPGLHGDK